MLQNDKNTSVGSPLTGILILLSVLFLKIGFISDSSWYWVLLITLPLLVIALINERLIKNDGPHTLEKTGWPHLFTKKDKPEPQEKSAERTCKGDSPQQGDTGKNSFDWPYFKRTGKQHLKNLQHLN